MSQETFPRFKIAIIGAGAVGATTAYVATLKNLAAEIILVDVNEEKEAGEVMDIADSMCFVETGCIKGADFPDAKDADIIVLAAGLPQKPGETRLDLVKKNSAITRDIFKKIGKLKKDAIVIVVANPMDVLTYLAQEISGLPKSQVFGSGTVLDTARLKNHLAHILKINSHDISGFVIGEHGDSELVAWSSMTAGGAPIEKIKGLDKKTLREMEEKTKKEAYEIISRKGATFYGIAMSLTEIMEAIIYNQRRILPVSARIDGWNDVSDVCAGVPAVIGREGVLGLWPLALSADERKQFKKSADILKEYIKGL